MDNFTSNKINQLKQHLALSQFVNYILIMICAYGFIIEILDDGILNNTPYLVELFWILFFIPIAIYLKKTNLPLSLFGFNWGNPKRDIAESIFFSIIFCVIFYFLKKNVLLSLPLRHTSVFYMYNKGSSWGKTLLTYILFTFVQTIAFQGFLQSSLMYLTRIRHAVIVSVIVSAIVFSYLHIDLHFYFALATIIPSIFWSLLYAKQKSLLGVTISHALIGAWSLWFLGFGEVFVDMHHIFNQ